MASAIDAGRDMIVCGLRSVRIYVFPLQRDRVMELHSALSLFIRYMCNTFPFTKKSFFKIGDILEKSSSLFFPLRFFSKKVNCVLLVLHLLLGFLCYVVFNFLKACRRPGR